MTNQQRILSVLGSTGSIGRQTLDTAERLGLSVAALTGNRNTELLEQQARRFRPRLVVTRTEDAARDLRIALADTDIAVASGLTGLTEAAALPEADTVVTAVTGMIGLKPTLAAIKSRKRIALANKETLVCAGELVMACARETGAEILPVDSEHSAIFQCLEGNRGRPVRRILLTASGGPFFGMTRDQLASVTREQALQHPNWSMGAKITVDSATMMNKGLELIEAMRLYDLPAKNIEIVVHRESIIHSMVEYSDGAVLAQLAVPDMRLPIEYALTWPERGEPVIPPMDFTACPPLTFAKPDEETFGCLRLARQAAERPGTACAVLNGANEAAVRRFLRGEIGFLDIEALVARALEAVPRVPDPDLEDILAADAAARRSVEAG